MKRAGYKVINIPLRASWVVRCSTCGAVGPGDPLRGGRHLLEVSIGSAELNQCLWVTRVIEEFHGRQELATVLTELVLRAGLILHWLWRRNILGWGAGRILLPHLTINRAGLALARHSGGLVRVGWLRYSIMYSLHVVTKVPMTRESISRDGSVTVLCGAEEWFFAVSVHGMGLALMAKKAGG